MSVAATKKKQELIERFGLDPVPKELRTSKWLDYTFIQIAFSVNAGNFLVPAMAVLEGGLSFKYAVLSTVLGASLAFFFVAWLSLPGATHGIPSQYAIRSIIGVKGARFVASPIRTITSMYWFAVQTIGGTYVISELSNRLFNVKIPFLLISLTLAAIMTLLALIGFDAIKKATKFFIPVLFLGQGSIIYLYITTDQLEKTFLSVVTDTGSFSLLNFLFFASLAFIQYVSGVSSSADIARYAQSKRHSFYGLLCGNIIGFTMAALLAAYSASAMNHINPFVSATTLSNSYVLIAIITISALFSMVSINMSNAYTGSFSLLNSIPSLGRIRSALIFGGIAIIISSFPTIVTEAKQYISLLGAFVIPLSAVIITDFMIVKRSEISMKDLEKIMTPPIFQFNKSAFLAIIVGIISYVAIDEHYSPGFSSFLISTILYMGMIKVDYWLRIRKNKNVAKQGLSL
ncbi:purine-cytosine permease family protein [Bacillus pinisoli]|uniref:purine-cytosine permease family protein n=1 Tax=Bacillus pinisoli TaxID=2901866 RepID=UPI001FF1D5E2|nr:cytosine permease [Bacillus pinisoli]